jgi:NADH:ubiquinone oxidoreductase subunit 2 (subunit N)
VNFELTHVALGAEGLMLLGFLIASWFAPRSRIWLAILIYGSAAMLVPARNPAALLGIGVVAAHVLPRLGVDTENRTWRAALLLGTLTAFAGLTGAGAMREISPRLSALAITLGFTAMVGAFPFGSGMRAWLIQAPAWVFALVCGCGSTALLLTLLESQTALAALRANTGPVIALFGATTLLVAGMRSLGARSWRELAADGVIADTGLALVAIGALDTRGAMGAALVITGMVLTRILMVLLDEPGPATLTRRLAGWVAAASAAGLPPAIGFPARLLVLGAAIRVHPVVAAITVAGMVLLLPASFSRVLSSAPPRVEEPGRRVTPVAGAIALAIVLCGVVPGAMLATLWGLG